MRGVQAYCPPPPHAWTRLHRFPGLLSLPQVSKADIQPGRDTAVFSDSFLPGNLLEHPLSFPHALAVKAGNSVSWQTSWPVSPTACRGWPVSLRTHCILWVSEGVGGDGTLAFHACPTGGSVTCQEAATPTEGRLQPLPAKMGGV